MKYWVLAPFGDVFLVPKLLEEGKLGALSGWVKT